MQKCLLKDILMNITLIILILAISNIVMPTTGILKKAVFTVSPRSAFTLEYEYISTESNGEEIYFITKNPPVEKTTQGELKTWAICKLGPFKYAKYYGE